MMSVDLLTLNALGWSVVELEASLATRLLVLMYEHRTCLADGIQWFFCLSWLSW